MIDRINLLRYCFRLLSMIREFSSGISMGLTVMIPIGGNFRLNSIAGVRNKIWNNDQDCCHHLPIDTFNV